MNLNDDDDSVFEQALRADLPSMSEQNRLRQRILAAGIAAGTALGSANVAAAQASFGASALSKLSALSWPAKLGLTAALAAPVTVIALPLTYAPVPGAALVSQVRSSAAAVRAHSVAKSTIAPAQLRPLEAAPLEPPASAPAADPEPANVAVRPVALLPSAATTTIDSAQTRSSGRAVPATAAVDSTPQTATSEAEPARNSSTLAAETQLLDGAFAALAARDRNTAAALIAEHAQRFPNGLLRQERERARARLAQDPKGE